MDNDIVSAAKEMAVEAHKGQMRKWSKEPYIVHPGRVVARLEKEGFGVPETLAAAWLHDVIEDTNFPHAQIAIRCGPKVFGYVWRLTNPSKQMVRPDGFDNDEFRALKKQIDREHLVGAPLAVKLIKLCDRIDNLGDLRGASLQFKRLYALESSLLLDVIHEEEGDNSDDQIEAELLDLIKMRLTEKE